jgi:lipopolysaccharide/colanic/teichoic acid biosynthesis glycosyltransferase
MLSPILSVIALAVFLESGLPILFLQTRVGRNGQLFRIVKIRTMRSGASGCGITISGDPRLTRVGAMLRKFKLDELPQLWNVVVGQMSLVGPRPEVPEFVNLSEPVWRSVLRVRPGITDPVSVAYRDEEKLLATADNAVKFYRETVLPDKLARTLRYIENRSAWSDFLIIMQTVWCAAFPERVESKGAELVGLGDPR